MSTDPKQFGFNQVTTHIIKPSLVPDPEKKQKFVDRLKGKARVKVLNVTSGVTFTMTNTATQEMHTIMRHGDKWMMWGSCEPITLTNHELEDYLSIQWDIAQEQEKDIRIMDEYGCLEWLPK